MTTNKMSIQEEIARLEERLRFLKEDKTEWKMLWKGPEGYTGYNHGPYLRKLERKRIAARLKRLRKGL